MHAPSDDQLAQIKLAARLYYIDCKPQNEVARILGVSQAKVSRLLQSARESGVVQITVGDFEPRDSALESALLDRFDLHRTAVIRNVGAAGAAGVRRKVGYFGASVVADEIRSGGVVGSTGGRTLSELIRRIAPQQATDELSFVQLMGNIGAEVNRFDSMELVRRLAFVYGGSFYSLNSPAFASSAASAEAFLAQEQVASIWSLFKKMDLALVGIGSLEDSAFIDRKMLSAGDLQQLRRAGAVGEICGRFFNSRGHECSSDFRDRAVSIPLSKLRRIASVIGVTAGVDRAAAVAAAIRGGLIKSLIVDSDGAQAVLDYASGDQRSKRRKRATA